jgi:hypothetical protein
MTGISEGIALAAGLASSALIPKPFPVDPSTTTVITTHSSCSFFELSQSLMCSSPCERTRQAANLEKTFLSI